MLNYRDQTLQTIIASDLTAQEARKKLSAAYYQAAKQRQSDATWQGNQPALMALTQSYTTLLADKLFQAITEVKALHPDFIKRLWLNAQTPEPDHSVITFYLASETENIALLTLQNPLTHEGHLKAENLPTLAQMTHSGEEALQYSAEDVNALSVLVKILYTADYRFNTIDETVLQPIDGLAFETKYDDTSIIAVDQPVAQPGEFTISTPLHGASVISYQVLDEENHNWLDLGSDSHEDDHFTWSSTTIPEELVGHALTLHLTVRAGENVPALDELFVIASNNAILMRPVGANQYALDLPNHNVLTVEAPADDARLHLAYPEATAQIIELNADYPFFGEWLKTVLPQKRAFN